MPAKNAATHKNTTKAVTKLIPILLKSSNLKSSLSAF